MFILYALPIGLAIGLAMGGRLDGLADLRFRWPWLFVGGLLVQVVLFSGPVSERIGDLGPPIYVASTAIVFLAVLANRATPGLSIVALGAASNLLAIVANGGYMPASAAAMAALDKVDPSVYSNSAIRPDAVLTPLTDVFALPAWLPFANVFSVGDVIIGLGVVVTIVIAMRASRGAREQLPQMSWATRTVGSWDHRRLIPSVRREGHPSLRSSSRPGQTRREAGTQSQGSPLETAQPPARWRDDPSVEGELP